MNISVSRNRKAEILSNKHKIITLILLLFAWTTLEKKSHDNTFHFKSSLQQLKITCWFDVFQQQYDTKNEKQEPAAHTAHALRSWMSKTIFASQSQYVHNTSSGWLIHCHWKNAFVFVVLPATNNNKTILRKQHYACCINALLFEYFDMNWYILFIYSIKYFLKYCLHWNNVVLTILPQFYIRNHEKI